MRVTLEGIENIQQRLDQIASRAEHPEQPLRQSAEILSRSMQTTFSQQGRPAWQKRRHEERYRHPILDKTGRMKRAATSTAHHGESICRVETAPNESSLEIGLLVEYGVTYADYHQHAEPHVSPPQRSFMGIYPEDVEEIREIFRQYVYET
jgi:phage gpG-like protein